MRAKRIATACAVLLAAAVGCRPNEPVAPLEVCPASGISISVGDGLTPEISWTPQCRASEIAITRLDASGSGGTTVWSHSLDVAAHLREIAPGGGVNRLTPPVAYGTRAPHLSVSSAPPLEVGHRYTVVLRALSSGSSTPYTVATATFHR